MLAAANPLSAVFWSSAEAILQQIADGEATVGDVRTWLEATGTEPNGSSACTSGMTSPSAASWLRRCTPGW